MRKTPSAGCRMPETGPYFLPPRPVDLGIGTARHINSFDRLSLVPSCRQMLCMPSKFQLAENNSDGRGCQLFIASLRYYLHALFEH